MKRNNIYYVIRKESNLTSARISKEDGEKVKRLPMSEITVVSSQRKKLNHRLIFILVSLY